MGPGTESKIREVIYAIGMLLRPHQEVGEVLLQEVTLQGTLTTLGIDVLLIRADTHDPAILHRSSLRAILVDRDLDQRPVPKLVAFDGPVGKQVTGKTGFDGKTTVPVHCPGALWDPSHLRLEVT